MLLKDSLDVVPENEKSQAAIAGTRSVLVWKQT
jgi:hypothetical protein